MGDDQTDVGGEVGAPRDDFEETLEATIALVYPVLCQRIQTARFAGWHRGRQLEGELANDAAYAFMRHCDTHRRVPDDPLGYLVAIARNLAKKQYAARCMEPAESYERVTVSHRDRKPFLGVVDDEEAVGLGEEKRMELVRAALDKLPRRQRKALELYLAEPGATQKELGQMMGIGEDGFKRNLDRAVESIHQLLEKDELGHPIGGE